MKNRALLRKHSERDPSLHSGCMLASQTRRLTKVEQRGPGRPRPALRKPIHFCPLCNLKEIDYHQKLRVFF